MSDTLRKTIVPLVVLLLFSTFSLVHAQEQAQLRAPANLWFHGNTLNWDAVEGADLYFPRRIHDFRVYITSVRGSNTEFSYDDLEKVRNTNSVCVRLILQIDPEIVDGAAALI